MADAELIEQIRAQVKSLKSPRHATPGRGTNDTTSSEGSSRGRVNSVVSGQASGRTSATHQKLNSSPRNTENKAMDNTVVLDVGGVKYRTTINTLKFVESPFFNDLIEGLWDPLRTEEGHLFIDRNGQLFDVVLEYLRNCTHQDKDSEVELPTEMRKLKALKREADFYVLPGLSSQINKAIQEMEEREQLQNEAGSDSSVVVKEDEASEKEFDIIFHSISSTQCSFPEDRLQDLVGRVNYTLAAKEAEGYKINSSTSDLIFDASKTYAYSLFIQITLIRDRKNRRYQLPMSSSGPEKPRTVSQQMPLASYTQPMSCDSAVNESMEYVAPQQSRRMAPARSPRTERQFSSGRYSQPADFLPDVMHSPQHGGRDHLHHQNSHRMAYAQRYVDHGEWSGSYDMDQGLSPRGNGGGHYQPNPHVLHRKPSTRMPYPRPADLMQSNSHKYTHVGDYLDEVGVSRVSRHDGWVNQAPSVQ